MTAVRGAGPDAGACHSPWQGWPPAPARPDPGAAATTNSRRILVIEPGLRAAGWTDEAASQPIHTRAVQDHATVDDEVLPGHEPGRVGTEEHHDVRDIFGRSDTSKWCLHKHAV